MVEKELDSMAFFQNLIRVLCANCKDQIIISTAEKE
jgi:hypothetical protein